MRQFHPGSMSPPLPSSAPPPFWQVLASAAGAVVSMAAAVYFAGHELTPIALVLTSCFVGLGGLSFELARRRFAASSRS
jgi:hypothetical protein